MKKKPINHALASLFSHLYIKRYFSFVILIKFLKILQDINITLTSTYKSIFTLFSYTRQRRKLRTAIAASKIKDSHGNFFFFFFHIRGAISSSLVFSWKDVSCSFSAITRRGQKLLAISFWSLLLLEKGVKKR